MIASMQDLQAQVAKDLGVEALAPEEQQEVIAAFGEVALKAATLALVEKLPAGKKKEFAALLEAGDAAALQHFLTAELPEHEELARAAVAREIEAFKAAQAS